MSKIGLATLVTFLLFSAPCRANSFTGIFIQDDNVVTIPFTLGTSFNVGFRTFSWAGGVNGNGATIASGGFAPILSLFDASTDLLLTAASPSSTVCGVADPTTGACWDVDFNVFLNPGSYFVALTEDDNSALGPAFSDGFFRAGQGNFTGNLFLGSPASFISAYGDQRDGHWALDISAPVTAAEPGTLPLSLVGLSVLGIGGLRLKWNVDRSRHAPRPKKASAASTTAPSHSSHVLYARGLNLTV